MCVYVYVCIYAYIHYVSYDDMYISVSTPYYFQLIFTALFWSPFSISTEIGFILFSDLVCPFVSLFHTQFI